MNRTDFQKLARTRLREAKALRKAGQYSGAYYLAGYSIECALKACIAKSIQRHDFPEKDKTAKSYSHNLRDLLGLAQLDSALKAEMTTNSRLAGNWSFLLNWSERSRYEIRTRSEADDILNAISKRTDGVLPWITQHW